ncbi:FliM/FliN family flagellar motor switch protein [uncultured Litoreibacter sp.]|uniref:FliM/FliN family flagellar motor switch protein n=1 Tax=uncultured Litoreibacter sp. TaxID=1392394 RepID=UPI002631BA9C|nr:FliM/FliN family flagellar motor switch protein [uncultured Litoreibacter sp.]
MTGSNTALAQMVRPSKPKRGASHIMLEDIADSLFRGPAKIGHSIDLLIRDAQAQRMVQAKAIDCIDEIAVPHVLEGPDGVSGLIVFDGVLVDALIEQQTLGRISAAPRVERPVTEIDAALCTGFAASVVAKLAELSVDRRDASALAGFSYVAPQIDRASLSLTMSEKAYDVLRLSLDLGPGLKVGQAILMFPAAVEQVKAAPKKINPDMVEAIQDCELGLLAYLPSVRLPVQTLLSMEPDMLIALPEGILEGAQLRDGRNSMLAKGRIGQIGGCRALRLEGQAVSPSDGPAPIPQMPAENSMNLDATIAGTAMEPLGDLQPVEAGTHGLQESQILSV